VHGANRLGGNSLLEAVVFGARAGEASAAYAQEVGTPDVPTNAAAETQQRVEDLLMRENGPRQAEIRDELAAVMQEKVGVYRSGPVLEEAKRTVTALKEKFQSVTVDDKGKTFNTDLIHTIETGYLLDLADCMVTGAIARHESRGAHSRTDFTERDDENWMKHTLAYLDDGEIRLDYSPVTMTKYEPQVRTY
jgi:succinate dehydrogenase / fumarate reductase flavoprotein subunit